MLTVDYKVRERLLALAAERGMNPCYQCGTCTAICPMGVPVRRAIRMAQLGIAGGVENLWHCTTCKICEVRCPRGVEITKAVHGLRVLAFEGRKAPEKLEGALWGTYEEGNPWGGKKAERGKWAEALNLKDALKGVDVLLYVGCATSYDARLQKVASSLARILGAAGVDFGILGKEERCCGDVVYQTGEESFLEELVQGNVETFRRTKARTIVSISPHCFNTFKALYPRYGLDMRVLHYTELLAELLDQGKMSPKGSLDLSISYHDPCYLGRYFGAYEAPRKLIEAVPGVKLVEMEETRENALCCGGGGGVQWLEVPGERLSHRRVQQAADTGAKVLATSCPYCIQNFEDALRTKGLSEMRVLDISEILATSMTSPS